MLFLVYINDIDSMEAAGGIVSKFLDDTKVDMLKDKEGRERLQSEINNMVEWIEKWQIKFNTSKHCDSYRLWESWV